MRIVLAAIVIIIGANIGIDAINSVSKMQDARMLKLCKVDPTIVSNCRELLKPAL
jgi:hypothetical protein